MARNNLREAGWNEPVTVIPEGAHPGDGRAFDTSAWNAAAMEQERERQAAEDAETQKYGRQVMADFDNIVAMGNQQRAETRRMHDATLGALMLQARKNNGFVPSDVRIAASKNLGMPVAGGNYDDSGNFILYGLRQGQGGRPQMAPIAIASPEMQFQTLHRAKMGLDYQRELYGGLSRRYTPEQLGKMGLSDPDRPETVGGTTIGGGTARRLGAGILPPERRGISAFSADGKGGFSRINMGEDGVTAHEDFGRRDPNHNGKWKQISVGPDPEDDSSNPRQIRRYENDKTGEVVTVRDGENPPWERAATSEKERIAKMNNDSREAIQAFRSQAAREVAETSAQATKEKAQLAYEAAAARLDAAMSRKRALSASDLRALSDIGKNHALPEEARNAAVDKLVSLLYDRKGGADADTAVFKDVDEFKAKGGSYKAGDRVTVGDTVYELGRSGRMTVVGKVRK